MRLHGVLTLALACWIAAAQARSLAEEAAASAPAAKNTSWAGVELSSSAVWISMYEVTPMDLPQGKALPERLQAGSKYYMCYDQIDNARSTNAKSIQFVPTIHWKGTDTRVDSYCYRAEYMKCIDVTDPMIAEFKDGMQKCIQYAVDQGFTTIAMLPHLDNDATYYWRNKAWFDPMVKVKGEAYHDILVAPVAKAMNAVAKGSKVPIKMYLTLQGETGKAIIFGPRAWITSMQLARADMGKDLTPEQAKNMKVGAEQGWL
jgi:hypothetical protein